MMMRLVAFFGFLSLGVDAFESDHALFADQQWFWIVVGFSWFFNAFHVAWKGIP